MEAFPDSERRQERRFNRKGVVMNIHRVLAVCCENKSKVGMEAFPDSERRQEHRFNRKGAQALVSFKKYMPPPLPYFKVNIYPFLLPHFASIYFAYL
jgi:hypothetical protein